MIKVRQSGKLIGSIDAKGAFKGEDFLGERYRFFLANGVQILVPGEKKEGRRIDSFELSSDLNVFLNELERDGFEVSG